MLFFSDIFKQWNFGGFATQLSNMRCVCLTVAMEHVVMFTMAENHPVGWNNEFWDLEQQCEYCL